MNTNELITEVRNGLVEYQVPVISNSVIISNLNHAMRQIYNHYARSDDNMFGKIHELEITTGTRVYTLPRTLWSKRVDYMQVPTPGDNAKGYEAIEKIDAKRSHKYNLPDTFSTIPYAWQQLGDEIEIFPKPQRDVTARLIVQPRLLPLAYVEGSIYTFATPIVTCVDDLSTTFAAYAALSNGNNYLSICDGVTGQLKHVVRFTGVSGADITLATPGTRTSIKGQDFSLIADLTDLTIDDTITYGLSTGTSILGEAFDEYLVKYAILSIKAALNENDPVYREQLAELKKDYTTERSGRPGTTVIERTSRNQYSLNRFRRSR